MAANNIPNSIPQLFALAQDAEDGAIAHGAAIGLVHNTGTNIGDELEAARAAEAVYAAAKTAKDGFSAALRTADSNARAFLKACSAYFRQVISQEWTAGWEATGFPNQTPGVPDTQDERMELCDALDKYFTANPTKEISNGSLVLTAARAHDLFVNITDARIAVNEGNTDAAQKKVLRDAAVETLKARLRGLIAELGQLLDDTDPLWLAFGLNEPGAASTPDVPEAVVVTPGAAGVLHVDWATARLAGHYRVWKKVLTVDANAVAVVSPTDTEATLSGLPGGKTVEIYVTSVNDAGESTPSAIITAVVP